MTADSELFVTERVRDAVTAVIARRDPRLSDLMGDLYLDCPVEWQGLFVESAYPLSGSTEIFDRKDFNQPVGTVSWTVLFELEEGDRGRRLVAKLESVSVTLTGGKTWEHVVYRSNPLERKEAKPCPKCKETANLCSFCDGGARHFVPLGEGAVSSDVWLCDTHVVPFLIARAVDKSIRDAPSIWYKEVGAYMPGPDGCICDTWA